MRAFFACLFCFCFCHVANAQLSKDERAILNVPNSKVGKAGGGYVQKAEMPAFVVDKVSSYLLTDTLLYLSADEKACLLQKLRDAQHVAQWTKTAFKDLTLLKGDSTAIAKLQKPYFDLYYFARPVFFRNNTLCVFYFNSSYYSGVDPTGVAAWSHTQELWICERKNNSWTNKIQIFKSIAD